MSFHPNPETESQKKTAHLLDELTQEVKTSNSNTANLNKSIFWLTVVMAIVAVLQFFIDVLPKITGQ